MECSICFEAISTTTGVATLSCSHSFHICCIASWFINLDKGTCPCCRKEMSALEDLPHSFEEEEDDDDDDSDDSDDSDEEEEVDLTRFTLDALLRIHGGQGLTDAMALAISPDFTGSNAITLNSQVLNSLLIGNGARTLSSDEWVSLIEEGDDETEDEDEDEEEDEETHWPNVRWHLHKDGSWVKDVINPEEITVIAVSMPISFSNALITATTTSAANKMQSVWRTFKGRRSV